MKCFAKYKNMKKMPLLLLVFFLFTMLFSASPFYAFANKEKLSAEALEGKNYKEREFLQFESHNVLPKQVRNFIAVKDDYDSFYYKVQNQLPVNAYLLDIFVPSAYKKRLDSEHYVDVTRMVSLYTMPLLLPKRDRLHVLQLSFVTQTMDSVFATYEPLAIPTPKKKLEWENNVFDLFKVGKSVYFKYPKKEDNYIYTTLQIFAMGEGYYTGAFLSTHVFIRDRQVYFLSASTFLTENNYYEELMWTRDTLDDFILLLPEVIKEVTE